MKWPLKTVLNDHLGVFQRVLANAATQSNAIPESPPMLCTIRDQKRVGIAWFSDTVIVYGRDNSKESSRLVLETTGWLLFRSIFSTYVRLRAGIDFGEFYAHDQDGIYVGRALVRAYELQEAQDWYGGALTPEAVAVLPTPRDREALFAWWVCPYDVPLKTPKMRALSGGYASNWPQGIHPRTDIPWTKEAPEPSPSKWQATPTTCRRWQNTRDFHRAVCRGCY